MLRSDSLGTGLKDRGRGRAEFVGAPRSWCAWGSALPAGAADGAAVAGGAAGDADAGFDAGPSDAGRPRAASSCSAGGSSTGVAAGRGRAGRMGKLRPAPAIEEY